MSRPKGRTEWTDPLQMGVVTYLSQMLTGTKPQHVECNILHDGVQVWLWLIAPLLTTIVPLKTASGIVVIMFTSVASASISAVSFKCKQAAMGHQHPPRATKRLSPAFSTSPERPVSPGVLGLTTIPPARSSIFCVPVPLSASVRVFVFRIFILSPWSYSPPLWPLLGCCTTVWRAIVHGPTFTHGLLTLWAARWS